MRSDRWVTRDRVHDVFTSVRALFKVVKPYILLLLILWVYQGTELIYLEIVSCELNPRGNGDDDELLPLWTKPSGLYRHQGYLGLHMVGCHLAVTC